MSKVKIYIFDDWKSYVHAVFGALCAVFLPYSIILAVIYLVYQIAEKERMVYKLGDVIEFLIGYYTADTILHLITKTYILQWLY